PTGTGCHVDTASGGHPPALLLRAAGGAEHLHGPGGQLVGIVPDPHFAPVAVDMVAGDTLLLYTDGLTERRVDRARHRYDEDALREYAASLAPATAPAIVDAVRTLLSGAGDGFEGGVDDDAAVLAIGVPPDR
ncbi:MAG TPA: PP2C family protein-serine/threonine phosphatase, partial [Pseudonocardia sp.]|nr:PP2C family protein-serine/threonine phosphatase [Pseudonocardia sp.]